MNCSKHGTLQNALHLPFVRYPAQGITITLPTGISFASDVTNFAKKLQITGQGRYKVKGKRIGMSITVLAYGEGRISTNRKFSKVNFEVMVQLRGATYINPWIVADHDQLSGSFTSRECDEQCF